MSLILDLLNAVFKLGLPLAGASWFLFDRMYGDGNLERSADRKALKLQMKSMKAALKSEKKKKEKKKEKDGEEAVKVEKKPRTHADIVFDKWMWFGSGFYGLAALWTFVIIELTDLYNFIFHFPGLSVLFGDGVMELIVNLLVNQLQNIVTAFVWFSFWDADSILLWVLVAYGGYWVGIEIARRELTVPAAWVDRLRAILQSYR